MSEVAVDDASLDEDDGPNIIPLKLKDIKRDTAAQPRQGLNMDVVEQYAAEMAEGSNFPPIVVFGDDFYLGDGWHRFAAAEKNGYESFDCEVKEGGLREAILYSVSANAAHGLQRSYEDKRRAVTKLLEDEEWSKWSDRAVARQCNVSHTFVGKVRDQLNGEAGEKPSGGRKVKRGDSTYEMKPRSPAKKKPKAKSTEPLPDKSPVVPSEFMTWPEMADALLQKFDRDKKALNADQKAALVVFAVTFGVLSKDCLPSPEKAEEYLKRAGVEMAPSQIMGLAQWYEGLSFTLDAAAR